MQPGVYQRLGTRTFVFTLLQRASVTVVLIIVLIVVIVIQVFAGPALVHAAGSNAPLVGTIFDWTIAGGIFLICLVAAGTILWTYLEYVTYSYMIDEHAFRIKRGIFSIEEISVMYRQMQDVDVERPLLYRLFGLSRVVILTAGHEDTDAPNPDEAEGILEAVPWQTATQIQTELLRRSNIEEVVAVPASERQ